MVLRNTIDLAGAVLRSAKRDSASSKQVLNLVEEQVVWTCVTEDESAGGLGWDPFMEFSSHWGKYLDRDLDRWSRKYLAEQLGVSTRQINKIVTRFRKSSRYKPSDYIMPIDDPIEERVETLWQANDLVSIEELEEQANTRRPEWEEESLPNRLRVYRFDSDAATRESFVLTLEQSAWMAENLAVADSKVHCTVWVLLQELKAAETIERYDQVVRAICELGRQQEYLVEFVSPPEPQVEKELASSELDELVSGARSIKLRYDQ